MKFLFAAGGTGGHINPALAVAQYIRDKYPDSEIIFVGTSDRMEAQLVPAAGFELRTIKISGFQRGFSFSNIKFNVKTAFNIFTSSKEAKKIIKDFGPDVAIGFGGYVSGPVIRTAVKLGVKTVIHEQNAFPGVTNKVLASKVDRVLLTVDDAKKYMKFKNEPVVTGLPVRGELFKANREMAREKFGFDDRPVILSVGGSLGARKINDSITELIAAHREDKSYYHIHAMGKYGAQYMPEELLKRSVSSDAENLRLYEYINNMAECYAACDLVIARSGASTLSELQALGKPSILIPSPNVAENHQYHNAMAMVNRGAAVLIEEKDLNKETLNSAVDKLLSDADKLEEIGKNAKNMAINNSTERIGEIIIYFANNK
ncbi:MAG: undecaprenyldiphospho-muramoylpentapeptide beta-N-acetylglucosaminyltransferase [Clostridia bacterium]|nr:undecaprenyldiphospho-muramoylpentapeptide beta-N-acetylglucosaminyltransferase [Clostridia bacterium]